MRNYRWALAWMCWILMFFAIEIPGLRTPGRVGTLSYQLGALYQTRTRRGRFIFAITVTGLVGALTAHILTPMNETSLEETR
jgi:hypothetical protein